MRLRALFLLCAAMLAFGATPTFAAMRIAGDRGGQIGHYLEAFAMLRSSGERVMVDGSCLSACTLVLGMIPHNRLCATGRARFGFHAAWLPGRNGQPVTSVMGTRALWHVYPPSVRRWIERHGGLSRHMIYLQGHDLNGIVRSCSAPAHHYEVRSHRHYRARRPAYRYVARDAAAYRR